MSKAIETPEQRSERGRAMAESMGHGVVMLRSDPVRRKVTREVLTSMDWLYHHDCRAKLTSSERQEFDLAFVRARAVAGVRPAVDLALAAMRKKLMLRLGRGRWGAL